MKLERRGEQQVQQIDRAKAERIAFMTRLPRTQDGRDGDLWMYNGTLYLKMTGQWYQTNVTFTQVTGV